MSSAARANRWLLGVGLAFGAATVLAHCATAQSLVECSAGQEACGAVCVTLANDTENCGKCGARCGAGQMCAGGACAVECPAGNTKCTIDGGATSCVNAKTDNANCGACGKSCKSGEVCNGGFCSGTCGDSLSGQTLCGGDGGSPYCAALKADRSNCGKCGVSCSADQVCASGVCQSACAPDQTRCGGDAGAAYCANQQSDNGNCGGCGVKCAAMESCVSGACTSVCGPEQLQCPGDGGANYCIDALTDNLNCGGCGAVCGAGLYCIGGACKKASATCVIANGLSWCFDNTNCGNACTSVCSSLGMTPVNDATAFNAQNSPALCQNISNALGIVSAVSVSSYTYACLEDSTGTHAIAGGLVGPILCSSYSMCPTNHRTNMDQLGVACGPGSRRSICACQ